MGLRELANSIFVSIVHLYNRTANVDFPPSPHNVKSRKLSLYTYKFSSTLNVRWGGDEIESLTFS